MRKMHQLFIVFFLLFWGMGIICPLLASAQVRVLRVGYVDTPGYLTREPGNRYSGYAYEYLRTLALYGNWQYEFIPGRRSECEQRLLDGTVDIVPGIVPTTMNRERFDFLSHPMGTTTLFLSMRNGQQAFTNGRTLRLGYLNAIYDGMDFSLQKFAEGEKTEFQMQSYNRLQEMLTDYHAEKLDGLVLDTFSEYRDIPRAGAFETQQSYLGVRKGNKELLQKLNIAGEQMMLSIPNLPQFLYDKYFANVKGMPLLLTHEEREFLTRHHRLRVLSSPGQKPYTYFEDGQHEGIIQEILEQMADDLGIELEYMETATNTEMMASLEGGKADLVSDIYCDFGWGDEHRVNLTIPYLKLDYVAIMRKNDKLPTRPMVACVKGHYYTHAFVEKMYHPEQRVYYDTVQECLRAVSRGTADLTYTKAVTAQNDIWKGDFYDLATNGTVVFSHDVAIGVNKDVDPLLLRILNKEIVHLDPVRVRDIVNQKTFESKAELNPAFVIYNYPIQVMLLFLVLALAAIGTLLYLMHLRRESLVQMQRLAYIDINTGMYNRHWFEAAVDKRLSEQRLRRTEHQSAVIVFGISRADRFVKSYGHAYLTERLQTLAKTLQEEMPWALTVAVNSSGVRVYCFACAEKQDDLSVKVQEVIDQLDLARLHAMNIRLNLKAGICFVPGEKITADQAVNSADIACNELHGKTERVCVFNNLLQDELEIQQQIEAYMQKALDEKEYEVWYQPKYDMQNHTCIGAEALVRWNSPELGFLMPGQFIPVFERNGFILQFDFYMLEEVCRRQKEELRDGKIVLPVSVNQSQLHMEDKEYLPQMREVARRYHLPRGVVELELTETAFADIEKRGGGGIELIHSLQDMGFSIAMDDFGSGYSSLTLLGMLPMDVMKIDRTLLTSAENSARNQIILSDAIALGCKLNMQVICEGIETAAQEEMLLRMGCRFGQGYLFAKPMNAADFTRFVARVNGEGNL